MGIVAEGEISGFWLVQKVQTNRGKSSKSLDAPEKTMPILHGKILLQVSIGMKLSVTHFRSFGCSALCSWDKIDAECAFWDLCSLDSGWSENPTDFKIHVRRGRPRIWPGHPP